MTLPLFLLAIAIVPMLVEAWMASRHAQALRRLGASEPPGDVYGVMQVAYPACFLAMALEAWLRGAGMDAAFSAGLVLFFLAKGLKYWAIATLGTRWTFRVLVPPGSARIVEGPYRWLRHPNYVGVAGELAGMAIMAQAPIAGTLSLVGFGGLMLARISLEERALGMSAHQLPRWVRAGDAAAAALLALAVWIALTGGTRYLVFDTVISLRSPLLFLYAAAAIQIVRHLLYPRPSSVDRLAALDARVQGRPALAAALAPFLATRVMVFVVGFFAVVTFGFPEGPGNAQRSRNPLIELPARWDAGWYGSIALDGYTWSKSFQSQQSIAFFPAVPLLARGVAIAFGSDLPGTTPSGRTTRVVWGAVLVSLIAFLWGLYYFVRLGQDLIGPERAANAALLLAAYPFAVFYSAPYTEALYLLGAVAACFHFGRREWAAASAWGLLVGLTRPNGCFLSVALAALAWQQLRETRAREAPGFWRAASIRMGVAAMPGIGMLIFTTYLYQLTGVWFAWSRSHAAWGRSFQGLTPFTSAIERLASEPLMQVVSQYPYQTLNSGALLFALILLWPTFRRLGAAWGLLVVINLASPLLAGGVLSMGRLTSTLFPLFLSLAVVLPSRAAGPCALAFGILQGLCAALFFTWRDLY